jgi:hypothetical protein
MDIDQAINFTEKASALIGAIFALVMTVRILYLFASSSLKGRADVRLIVINLILLWVFSWAVGVYPVNIMKRINIGLSGTLNESQQTGQILRTYIEDNFSVQPTGTAVIETVTPQQPPDPNLAAEPTISVTTQATVAPLPTYTPLPTFPPTATPIPTLNLDIWNPETPAPTPRPMQ